MEATLLSSSYFHCMRTSGKHEEALHYHKEELQLCESLQDQLGRAVANRKIGESLASLCHFRDALRHQQKYLELARSLGNVEEIQRAYTTIGRVWYMWMKSDDGDVGHGLEKARDAFLAGLRSCDELETVGTVSRKELCEMRSGLYLNLGLLADESGDSRTAEDHFQRATRIGK